LNFVAARRNLGYLEQQAGTLGAGEDVRDRPV
jgi:hypothetical protein